MSDSNTHSTKLDFTNITSTHSIEGKCKSKIRKTHWFLTLLCPNSTIENVDRELNCVVKKLESYKNIKQIVAQMENYFSKIPCIHAAITLHRSDCVTTIKDFNNLLSGVHIEYTDRDATFIRCYCSKKEGRLAGPIFIGFPNEDVGKLKYTGKWNEEKTKESQDPLQKLTQRIVEKCDAKILEDNVRENKRRKMLEIIKLKQEIIDWENIAEEDILDIKDCVICEYQHFADELERTEGIIVELKAKLEKIEKEPNSIEAPEIEENPSSRKDRITREIKRSWKQWNKDFKKRMQDDRKHFEECANSICDSLYCVNRRKKLEEDKINSEKYERDALFISREAKKAELCALEYSSLSKEERRINIRYLINLHLPISKEEDCKIETVKSGKKKRIVVISKKKKINVDEQCEIEYSSLSKEDRIIFTEFLRKKKENC